jgi:hypothetical protein
MADSIPSLVTSYSMPGIVFSSHDPSKNTGSGHASERKAMEVRDSAIEGQDMTLQ